MKLSKDRTYEEESHRWNRIWGCKTFTKKIFGESNALFMPFAFHVYFENKTVTFRGLNHWTTYHGTIDNILESEVKVKFDEEQLKEYFSEPLLVAKEAVENMAKKGWMHMDLNWRHVALLPYEDTIRKIWKVRPILIDLTHCKEITETDIDKAIEESIIILKSELLEATEE
jgi:hypothetical protein